MKRNLSRIKVLFKLYQFDLLQEDVNNDIFDLEFNKLLNESEVDEKVDEKFVKSLYEGIINNLKDIDSKLARTLSNYSLDRLSYVDRNLLRIGAYEILYLKEPKEVIINEIVNLSKEYSQTDEFLSSKFNNSVLDNLCKRYLD